MIAPDLWPHQQAAIVKAREVMHKHHRVVMQLPTGGGKTRVGTHVAAMTVAKERPVAPESTEMRSGRVLWLAHRTELIDQAYDALTSAGLHCGVIASNSKHPAIPRAPVQVASIQTLLAREGRPPADLIIADECHHLSDEGSPYWASLLFAYPAVRVLGLTATPERGDGTGMSPMFTGLIQVCSVRDLTRTDDASGEDKPLVPCRVLRPAHYLKRQGVPGLPLSQHPVDAYVQHAHGTQAFLFARTVSEAQAYATALCDRGVEARTVSADTPKDERAAIVQAFRGGLVRVLCNVYVFTEGTDLPAASTCILARGCSTAGQYLQMVGRVLRRAPGKRDALLIDLPGVSHLHGMPEDERVWSLDGRACKLASECTQCPVCKELVSATPSADAPCPTCGYAGPAIEDGEGGPAITEVLGLPLTPYHREFAAGPVQRHETALRWAQHAAIKGRKPGYVYHRYREVYGEGMPRATWRAVKAVCGETTT